MTKPVETVREVAVQEYSATPSKNPRYRGATPADVGRALLKRQPATPPEEEAEDDPGLKSGV